MQIIITSLKSAFDISPLKDSRAKSISLVVSGHFFIRAPISTPIKSTSSARTIFVKSVRTPKSNELLRNKLYMKLFLIIIYIIRILTTLSPTFGAILSNQCSNWPISLVILFPNNCLSLGSVN